jgi:Protein of unknown function (DUF2946)
MTAAAAESPGIRRGNPARRFVVFIAILAFAFQSYITQTHIHELQGFRGGATATHSSAPSKTPLRDSQTDCPFCQAVIHAGFFVASAAPTLRLPVALVETVALVSTAPETTDPVAHDWQSRAPPRL